MKSWFKKFLVSLIALILVVISTVYIIDPFNYYRWNDNRWMDSRFVTPGIIKNYDFNYAIIGSSMIQNMQMDWFKEKGYHSPVKLTKGGMNINEELLVMDVLLKNDIKVDTMLNIDIHSILSCEKIQPVSDYYPDYLFNEIILDDYKYWFNFDALFYYVPVNVIADLMKGLGIPYREGVKDKLDIDKIGEWISSYDFGKDIVLKNYLDENQNVSQIKEHTNLEIENKVDEIVNYLELYCERINKQNHILTIAFPPYSVLYWKDQLVKGTLDDIIYTKYYLIQKLLEIPNVKIIDLQSLPQINDLNNYKDLTHYNLDLQKIYADSIFDDKYTIEEIEQLENNLNILNEYINEFSLKTK